MQNFCFPNTLFAFISICVTVIKKKEQNFHSAIDETEFPIVDQLGKIDRSKRKREKRDSCNNPQ